ncbi:MAG: UvrD-helicase domain-containing protein, partial [Candidatus Omnitrophica bacterium]|nr:UvrD-helicase domain-containing protein [Candidatus Omnitrophota bacterium]
MEKNIKPVQILEASAGAGKTYALTKRYINLLLKETEQDPTTPFRSILGITFTNKASVEMKERI